MFALEDGLVMSFVMSSYSLVSDRVTSDTPEAGQDRKAVVAPDK